MMKARRSSLACACEGRVSSIENRPARLKCAGLREDGQTHPCCATDGDCAEASKDLLPNERRHSNVCHRKCDIVAGKCRRHSEHASNDGTQQQRPRHGEGDLSNRQRDAAGGDGNKRRAEDAGATVEGQNAGIEGDEKRQGVNGQREDQPAEHAYSSDVEEKPKGKHGGGSMVIDVMVAPSTATAAHSRV